MLLRTQQSQHPACKGKRTRTRERPQEQKNRERKGEIEEGGPRARGAADVTGTGRREGLLNQIESQAADVVGLSSWRPEHVCPLCAAAAVSWVT